MVREFPGYLEDVVEAFEHVVDEARLEGRSLLGAEQVEHLLERPGLLVDTLVVQGVENVTQRYDSPGQADIEPCLAQGIALAVPALVMLEGDYRSRAQERTVGRSGYLPADHGVVLRSGALPDPELKLLEGRPLMLHGKWQTVALWHGTSYTVAHTLDP